jgi:glutathione S-transferase
MNRLYHFRCRPFCRKVRLTLAEKRHRGGADRGALLGTGPISCAATRRARCRPAHGGRVMSESQAICEYLDETMPEPRLMPRDPEQRYEVRRLCAWFDDKFHGEVTSKLLYERVNKKVMGLGYPDSKARQGRRRADQVSPRLHGWLLDQRRWLAGDAMTLADFAAAAHLSCLDYIRTWTGTGRERQGLVRQDQVAPGLPAAAGRSGAGLSAARALCRSGFLIRAWRGGLSPPPAPPGIWAKMKSERAEGTAAGAGAGRGVCRDGRLPARCHPAGGGRLAAFLAGGRHGQMGWMAERMAGAAIRRRCGPRRGRW